MAERRTGARERVRAEMTEDIKRVAREHLATEGADLSLRAVARDVGMVSSAVYRYFSSRDDLLTALVVDAYDELADAADEAERAAPRRDPHARWMALARGIRAWSLAHPHEYALLYGSPVPGYQAPEDTVGPASRPQLLLAQILRDAVAGSAVFPAPGDRLASGLRADMVTAAEFLDLGDVPAALVVRGLVAWTQLFGALSFELFGRFEGGITDADALFEFEMRAMSDYLGLRSAAH
ncbi:TetR/AcrR family transcriptional regulator [Allobranchiibius sp. CTAmp26]|uniref:TetR/AcrR family transcriptional regulator n=1 Tax=Allobranchiibius sp. CTAmp26 TaxID=2815214 RepID=UPI001AA15B79|nr:TetR/AcrR family transcriptional regulator [Allobranchiibius sp. CTAmp26]MBO1756435.1 WHG domain-containing protein [Allobranchiibius sp. CTAmp26]